MKTINAACIFLLGAIVINDGQAAKILGIFPMSSKSHYILGSSLLKGLAAQGHEVTMISPYEEKNPPKNSVFNNVVLTGFVEDHDRKIKLFDPFAKKQMSLSLITTFSKMFVQMTEDVIAHPNVQNLLKSDATFDIVIIEEFKNHALKAIAQHYGAHLVILSTVGANSMVNELVGNPSPLSYIPGMLLGYSSHMTFKERLINCGMYLMQNALDYFLILPEQAKLVEKYFPGAPKLDDMIYNASLLFVNSHSSINQAVPYVPSMIDIGGYHIKPPKQLPEDLQKLLDNSKDGVIYFSLGSNFKGSNVPKEIIQAFTSAFSKLKQKIIWKWEEDELPGKPSNVHIAKWLPQQDILAHPNIKLFITHGGLLSTFETIYHGKPVLAIPLGGDQKANAQQMENNGIGLKLDVLEISEKALVEKINTLLSDPKYANNAKTRSKFYHDRQVEPMETVVYWIGYLMRHGTSHLRVAALDLTWYQYHLLDVIAFVLLVALISLVVIVKLIKIVIRRFCKKSSKKVKKH